MIGHLELAIGMLTRHASWAWLVKICIFQIFLRRLPADLDFIMNAERFTWIDGINRTFDYERNQYIIIIIIIFIVIISSSNNWLVVWLTATLISKHVHHNSSCLFRTKWHHTKMYAN